MPKKCILWLNILLNIWYYKIKAVSLHQIKQITVLTIKN